MDWPVRPIGLTKCDRCVYGLGWLFEATPFNPSDTTSIAVKKSANYTQWAQDSKKVYWDRTQCDKVMDTECGLEMLHG